MSGLADPAQPTRSTTLLLNSSPRRRQSHLPLHPLYPIPQSRRLFKLQIAGVFIHLLFYGLERFVLLRRVHVGSIFSPILGYFQVLAAFTTGSGHGAFHDVGYGFADGLGFDALGAIMGDLFFPAAFGFVDGGLHGAGDGIGVEDGFAVGVAGGAADGLDEGACGAEEAFFVGVEDGDEGDFGEVEAFAEEVDADEDVEFAEAQVADDFHAFDGVDVGVEVADADVVFHEVVGEVFGHAFGEGGDEDAFLGGDAEADFAEEVVYLAVRGADLEFGVEETGGADDLFDDVVAGALEFVLGGGGGDVDGLRGDAFPFFEFEGPVVHGGGEAEAVGDEVFFAGAVASVHGAELGDGDVGFVDDEEGVFGEVVEEAGGRFAGTAAREVAGVVFDALAVAEFLEHFEVVAGALFEALGFEEFVVVAQVFEAVAEFGFDVVDGAEDDVAGGDVVAFGVDGEAWDAALDFAGEGVEPAELFDLVVEEFDAHGVLFGFRRVDVDAFAAYAVGCPAQFEVVAGVLEFGEAA